MRMSSDDITLMQKLTKLGGITDRDELIKASSIIPDEELRLALVLTTMGLNKGLEIRENLFSQKCKEVERLEKKNLKLEKEIEKLKRKIERLEDQF